MKAESLKKRLKRDWRSQAPEDRPMTTMTIRMPEDVIEDLKRIAPALGFSGYQPLARSYIGQGLRVDMERLENDTAVVALIENLKRHGVDEDVIQAALSDAVKA